MLSRITSPRGPAPQSLRFAGAMSAAALSVLATGCATGPNANPADPLEPMNRVVFTVNDKADQPFDKFAGKEFVVIASTPVINGPIAANSGTLTADEIKKLQDALQLNLQCFHNSLPLQTI